MKHAIITSCDAKYGDFLIDHWLRSLRANVNLENIDIIVMDYGLTTAQRYYLQKNNTKVIKCKRDGHVTILRFRDISEFLRSNDYDQVMVCDGGDIIFQADISHLFDSDKDTYRAVCEDVKPPFELYLRDEFFSKENRKKIMDSISGKKMINAGVILAPKNLMIDLCDSCNEMIINKNKFGPDQLVVNYILYIKGFVHLDKGYNFVVTTAEGDLEIRKGVFYVDGEIIPVVHNTGNISFLRPVKNFGYGPRFNELKREIYATLKTIHKSSEHISDTAHRIREFLK